MTRARALKTLIRARAAKTGERYTTARRHVLSNLHTSPEPVLRFSAPAPAAVKALGADLSATALAKVEAAAKAAKSAAPAVSSKGGVSDASSRAKTGHGLDHWFEVMDRFGGVEKGHTALARHLHAEHAVPGWHAQGITVAYERARGARAVNQRCDGEYEVSASKVVAARPAELVKALTDKRSRARWVAGADGTLIKALFAALDSRKSKGIVVRADGQGRFRYKWGDTTVQLYFYPKPGDKVSVVATNSLLANSAMVEERRALWRKTLDALSRSFAPATRGTASR